MGPDWKNAFFKKKLMLFKDVSIKSNEIWSTESIQNSGYSVKRSRDLVTWLTFKEGRQAVKNRPFSTKNGNTFSLTLNICNDTFEMKEMKAMHRNMEDSMIHTYIGGYSWAENVKSVAGLEDTFPLRLLSAILNSPHWPSSWLKT